MRAGLAFAVALLPAVLASPQPHNYPHGHGYGHGYGKHGHLSGRPSPTAAGTAPNGIGNSTVGLGNTGRVTAATTPIPTLNANFETTHPALSGETPIESVPAISHIPASNTETTQAALSGETPIESGPAVNPTFTAKSDTCDSGTATVTYNPTVTVTVTPSVEDGSASAQPSEAPPSTETKKRHIKTHTVTTVAPKSSATPTSEEAASKSPEAPVPDIVTPQVSSTPVVKASENADTKSSKTSSLVPVPKPTKASVPDQAPTSVAVKPTSASSTAALPNIASVPSTNSGNKRGILASGDDMNQLVSAFDNSSKITWLGDWYSLPPPNLGSHIEFVPQNYGKQSDVAPHFEWTSNAKKSVQEGLKYFLSFGEPETPNDLLHMEPQEAVDLFLKEMQPYAGSVTIGAPSVTQPDRDLEWLSQFLDLCDAAGCSIGFVCVHWFWSATEEHIQDFKNVVTKAIGIAKGKPVWVDNFQATGTNADQQNFLNGVLPWLESNPSVARYAYVSPERSTGTGLLNPDGSISSLGEFYANF